MPAIEFILAEMVMACIHLVFAIDAEQKNIRRRVADNSPALDRLIGMILLAPSSPILQNRLLKQRNVWKAAEDYTFFRAIFSAFSFAELYKAFDYPVALLGI